MAIATADGRRLVTAELRFSVLERDGFRCVYCGKSAIDGVCLSVAFHADHVHPRSKGGSDSFNNLATACSDCNLGKGDRVLSCLPSGVEVSSIDELVDAQDFSESSGYVSGWVKRYVPWHERFMIYALVANQEAFMELRREFEETEYISSVAREAISIASSILLRGESPTLNAVVHEASGLLARAIIDINVSKETYYCEIEEVRKGLRYRIDEMELEKSIAFACSVNLTVEEESELLEKLVAQRRAIQTEQLQGTGG